TARDRCQEIDVLEFKIRLYNADGAHGYELPTSNTLGAIVFDNGVTGGTEFDVSPLLFIYGHSGFHTELKLKPANGNGKERIIRCYFKRRARWLRSWRKDNTPNVFHKGPRYMYAHYLDTLAIFRKLDSVSKIQEPEDVDRLISAEQPDP
ncbi:hypothetical protein Tco_0887422, partial [Tanacetum coccineum]